MAKIADEMLLTHAGREKSVAATKTYTGQMLHFYMLASVLADKKLAFEKIPPFADEALKLSLDIEELVQRYVFMENCVVVGRGLNYGNSYELALKLMETCYVVAEKKQRKQRKGKIKCNLRGGAHQIFFVECLCIKPFKEILGI